MCFLGRGGYMIVCFGGRMSVYVYACMHVYTCVDIHIFYVHRCAYVYTPV